MKKLGMPFSFFLGFFNLLFLHASPKIWPYTRRQETKISFLLSCLLCAFNNTSPCVCTVRAPWVTNLSPRVLNKKEKKLNPTSDLAQVQHKVYQVRGLERQSRQQERCQNWIMVNSQYPVLSGGNLISPLVCADLPAFLKNKKMRSQKPAEVDCRFYWRPLKA